MSNYPYARYTETFLEFLDKNPTFLDDTFGDFVDADHAGRIINMLKAKWNFYEIGGETEDTFKTYIEDTYSQWKDYYKELITNYEKEWDFTKGTIRKSIVNNTGKVTGTNNDEEIYYDLPHKQLSELKKYPDNVTSRDGTDTRSHDNKAESTFEDNRFYLDQKEKYLMMIRNVYDEFAYRFRDCFIMLYN